MAIKRGTINRNDQEVVRPEGKAKANHPNQRTYRLRCNHCHQQYGSNGCDVHQRKCPYCQDGQTGVDL